MYTKCLDALAKIRELAMFQAGYTGLSHYGEPFFPVAEPRAHSALPTLYIINAVSVLDDALEFCISLSASAMEQDKQDTLGRRIDYLDSAGRLNGAGWLRTYKDMRNKYAHEVGTFSSWDELWSVLDGIKHEIQCLQAHEL